MTDTQREAFEAKFPAPVGVTLFGKEYVWFGGNHHGKTCESYNNMWKAFQAGLEANTMQLQAIYDDMYRHKDIAQVAQKLFMLINGQAALAHSQKDEKPLWVKPKAYPESSVLCYLKLSNGKVIEGSCRHDWDGIGWYKGYPGMCNGFSMADPDVVGWMYKHQTKLTLEQLNAITNRKDE